MSKMDNPLAAATHLLAQREAFQQWSDGATARWHKKWLASPRTKFVMMGVFAAGVCGVAQGIKIADIGGTVGLVVGLAVIMLSLIVLGCIVADDANVKMWLNPWLNRQSKTYGVTFNTHHPRTLWGEYSQDQKTHLLSQMARLDEKWAAVKAEVLSLVNTSDLPYVWWQQMEQVIEQGWEQQYARNYHLNKHNEFLRAQNKVEAQIQPSVDVETGATPPVDLPEKSTNISL